MVKEKSKKIDLVKKTDTIKIKKSTLKYIAFGVVGLIALIFLVVILTGNNSPSGKANIEIGNAPILGDKKAKVQIIEFTDYYCGFCQRHNLETKPLLKANFIDNGKANYVMMNYLRVAPDAANAALCAREVGGEEIFWQYSNSLFQIGPQGLDLVKFTQIANTLGIGGTEFQKCLNEKRYNSLISQQTLEAQKNGVTGTPGFFINGKVISGACPYSTFEKAINAEIEGKSWSITNCIFSQN